MKEKKEPKATRPMLQSICDYRLRLHACIQDIRGNTAPVSQATMFKK